MKLTLFTEFTELLFFFTHIYDLRLTDNVPIVILNESDNLQV